MEYDSHPVDYVPRVSYIVSLSLMNGMFSCDWFVEGMLAAEVYSASFENMYKVILDRIIEYPEVTRAHEMLLMKDGGVLRPSVSRSVNYHLAASDIAMPKDYFLE